MVVLIRQARGAEQERLREIALAAKSNWGYDPDLVRAWVDGLLFEGGTERWVAEADGEAAGWASLLPPADGTCVLEDLWVAPTWMHRGIGRQLFRAVAERARRLGADKLCWSADPNAVGFYEQLGAHIVGETIGEWGRPLPTMEIAL